ncbi:hypothetical protein K490DRAFT_45829 [Saccharata proteae CBS 121410]|uniref:CID domain-containing protein n=1 Tax=Saccharata proteae CBS 121410 TaxID=1314787 RepID=A0A9P4HTT2_9PEZI|nr:hypothetical protein K490DRAFT_45829 [Saccharata proteae CBS 121410]
MSSSAEVAADFRDALQDLRMNSRPEISNLTIIAKENTEHAQAISKELESHIRTTRPDWKLPALYVLDSIVKNVGTPYTVYLGRNLYDTFVNTYTLVDNPTRKALEGLLRTWKQPVPESMETRPVFPVEVTRAIDNMLLKYKTAIMRHQTKSPNPVPGMNQRPAQSPFGMPPGNGARQSPAPNGMPFPMPPMPGTQPQTPVMGMPYPMPPTGIRQSPAPPMSLPYALPSVPSHEKVAMDVERFIAGAKIDFAANPYDPEKQKRLKTFLDLQAILQSQQLPPEQLRVIEQQLSLQSTQPPSLADMLRNFGGNTPVQTASTPLPPPPIPPPSAPPAAPLPTSTFSLLDTLRAQGLLGGSTTPMAAPAVPATSVAPPSLPIHSAPSSFRSNVELTKESVKRYRPDLVALLYEAKPNQCSTCGRRFPGTQEGKEMKRRHLDWHFKVRDPSLIKQAIHRSWYIGEKQWIDYREQDEAKPPPEANGNGEGGKASRPKFVRVPLDPDLVNAPCPICQDKFTPSRLDDEFVWMDAVQVGPKIYHNSCYEEVYGKARSTPPVSSLGKRAAEETTGTPTKRMHY